MASHINFSSFLESLGAFESGIDPNKLYRDNQLDWLQIFDAGKGGVDRETVDLTSADDLSGLQYHVHNTLGFLGKYQFGEPLLIDLGYYTPGPNGFYGTTATNEWQGTWTGKNGVNSKEDFMSSVQELAIREAFAMNMNIINARLDQVGASLDGYIGTTYSYTRLGVEHTAEVTVSGILASAHLQGPGGVANLLLNNSASSDEYGTNILFYMDSFGAYQSPFGTSEGDVLSGTEYSEMFVGGGGDNLITTGGGYDKIEITVNANGVDRLLDFDVTKDAVSLAQFDGLTYDDLMVSNNINGVAEVSLANNQTIVFDGVDAGELSAQNFVQGMITLGWSYSSGDTSLNHFNLQHDLIDLNYAFDLNSLALYEENGSAVIDVLNNNQRYLLDGISLSDLQPYHFIKAPIGFATLFDGNSPSVDPTPQPMPDIELIPDSSEQPAPEAQITHDDAYAFTWNWGHHTVINDFDLSQQVVDLQAFWVSYDQIQLTSNAQGDAVIDLSAINNQTITLAGIDLDQLSSSHIVGVSGQYPGDGEQSQPDQPMSNSNPGPDLDSVEGSVYRYTWNWGANDAIDQFDLANDTIDLTSFWADYSSIDLVSNEQGDAVIDLSTINNQTITLRGVSLDQISANHVTGVSGDMAQALGGGLAIETPVPGRDSYAEGDIFSFTWAWGSNDVVQGFDVGDDVIDLKSFWTSSDHVPLYNNSEGDAVIDLTALINQTITLDGISFDELDDGSIQF